MDREQYQRAKENEYPMRESRLFIILISLVMGLAGCSKETMIGEYVDRCAVRLDID